MKTEDLKPVIIVRINGHDIELLKRYCAKTQEFCFVPSDLTKTKDIIGTVDDSLIIDFVSDCLDNRLVCRAFPISSEYYIAGTYPILRQQDCLKSNVGKCLDFNTYYAEFLCLVKRKDMESVFSALDPHNCIKDIYNNLSDSGHVYKDFSKWVSIHGEV